MSDILSPKPNKSQPFSSNKDDAMTVHNNDGSKDNHNNNIHPVTRSNGGAPPNNTKRSAATPNSAQKKNEGAIALAGLFNGGDSNNDEEDSEVVAKVEPPALEAITEVVTLSSTSNDASSFETTAAILGNNNSNNLKEDLEALSDKRKVGEISTEIEQQDPLVKYVETECGIVPPPAIPPQHYQQQLTAGGIGEEPRKKMRRSAAAANGGGGTTTVVSTPQKVASILASQLPKTSVPPGVPMPRLPAVQLPGVPQQYLPPPPPSGKTSFEQLMQATTMTSPVPGAAAAAVGQPIYRALPTQWSAQRASPYLNGQVPQQQPQPQVSETAGNANRKDKSLGVLCTSFMELYKDAPPNRDDNGAVVEIVEVAEHLGVKRRRIYDIINILESIDIVARVKKNTYRWHGTGDLPKFFAKLQRDAIVEQTMKANGTWVEDPNKPKPKGMASTCQKLLQIFLSTGQMEFTLSYAADVIMGPAQQAADLAKAVAASEAAVLNPIPLPNPLAPPVLPPADVAELPPLQAPSLPDNDISVAAAAAAAAPPVVAPASKANKTKVRRMYDIANVLQALGVLTKHNVGSTSESNKPSLKWSFYLTPEEISQYGQSQA